MSHLIRISVLVFFAVAGVAVAVGLAVAPPEALSSVLARLTPGNGANKEAAPRYEPAKEEPAPEPARNAEEFIASVEERTAATQPAGVPPSASTQQAAATVAASPAIQLPELPAIDACIAEPAPTPAHTRPAGTGQQPVALEPMVSLLAPTRAVEAPTHSPVAQQIEQLEAAIERQEAAFQQLNDRFQNVSQPVAQPPLDNPFADDVPPAGQEVVAGDELPAPPGGHALPMIESEGDGSLAINFYKDDIRVVLDTLSRQGGLNILASESVQGEVSASLAGVDVMTALSAILRSNGYVMRREGPMLYVGRAEDFLAMDLATDRVGTRIYRPNYVTAQELQALITPMLTQGLGTVSLSSAAQQGIPSDGTTSGGDDFANSEVLIVRDYEGVLNQVDQIVLEVDTQPLQVSIQAMILSVKLDDNMEFGVDFSLLSNNGNFRAISGNPLASLASMTLDPGGLKLGFIDGNVSAFLNALESIGDTNVVASPRLMCLNKQRAEILIGSQLGYVSTTVTETAATQSVEFLEVGTQLRLRPYISPDGLIRMEVHPELSTGNVRVEEGFTLPDKELTTVTTNVMCRDGATMVIGGLIREDLATNTSQIPLLGSLPYAGVAFRQKREHMERREIIVLITPRIVFADFAECEGEQAACEFLQRQAIYFDKMSPISRRHYGLRYTRLARAAWDAGNASAALRYANLAVHFDPVNRDALDIRSQIIAFSPYGDRTINTHLRQGLAPWQHPVGSNRYQNWVLEDQYEQPPAYMPDCYDPEAPAPIYPTGPGYPTEAAPPQSAAQGTSQRHH